jgi:hypothetical protein
MPERAGAGGRQQKRRHRAIGIGTRGKGRVR